MRNKLNIPDNSIEYIYSSHFIEHLEHDDLIAHLCECYRILEMGGVLRLGVPDFQKVFRCYCAGDTELLESFRNTLSEKFALLSDRVCAMDYVNRSVYEFGEHKICLDMEKIRNLLIISGFLNSAISSQNFDSKIDVNARKEFTFFVEAIK
ncbi:MAG: methyltransferase domain-containing protein [Gallionella sp.]